MAKSTKTPTREALALLIEHRDAALAAVEDARQAKAEAREQAARCDRRIETIRKAQEQALVDADAFIANVAAGRSVNVAELDCGGSGDLEQAEREAATWRRAEQACAEKIEQAERAVPVVQMKIQFKIEELIREEVPVHALLSGLKEIEDEYFYRRELLSIIGERFYPHGERRPIVEHRVDAQRREAMGTPAVAAWRDAIAGLANDAATPLPPIGGRL